MMRIYTVLSSWTVVRVVLGLVLLTASALKGYDLATSPTSNASILETRWFLIFLVECEFLLALWLIAGAQARWAWRLAVACFSCLAAASLYFWVTGHTSCNCLGNVETHPGYTLFFDIAAVIALVESRATLRDLASVARRRLAGAVVMVLVVLVGIPVGVAMAAYDPPATLTEDGTAVSSKDHVVLKAHAWIDKPCPLLAHIDIGSELAQGNWIVVLYHHDREYDRTSVKEYRQLADKWAEHADAPGIALIQMPPYDELDNSLVQSDSRCRPGRLADVTEWLVTTPLRLLLSEGIVRSPSDSRFAMYVGRTGAGPMPASDSKPDRPTAGSATEDLGN